MKMVYSTATANYGARHLGSADAAELGVLASSERGWDGRFGSAMGAKHFRENYRSNCEFFDAPQYFDAWTQKLEVEAAPDHSRLNGHRKKGARAVASRRKWERAQKDWLRRQRERAAGPSLQEASVSSIVASSAASTAHTREQRGSSRAPHTAGGGSSAAGGLPRRPATTGSSRRGVARAAAAAAAAAAAPAGVDDGAGAAADRERQLEHGWHADFHESVSKFNDQLHDAQRDYFDLPRTKEKWNVRRRCAPGVGTNMRDAGTLRGEAAPTLRTRLRSPYPACRAHARQSGLAGRHPKTAPSQPHQYPVCAGGSRRYGAGAEANEERARDAATTESDRLFGGSRAHTQWALSDGVPMVGRTAFTGTPITPGGGIQQRGGLNTFADFRLPLYSWTGGKHVHEDNCRAHVHASPAPGSENKGASLSDLLAAHHKSAASSAQQA